MLSILMRHARGFTTINALVRFAIANINTIAGTILRPWNLPVIVGE